MIKRQPERRGCLQGLAARRSAGLGSLAAVGPALAGSGQPSPKQIGFQEAVTPVAHDIHWLHDYVNIIIFAITAFVLVLMLYVMWRFSEKRNPIPSRTTHNTTIEVLWTVLPVLDPGGDRHPLLQAALLPVHLPAARPDHQGHRPRLELDARVSRTRASASIRSCCRTTSARRPIKAGMPAEPGAAQPRRRQRDPGAGQQGRARARHLHRRDPRLDHSLVRLQGRCRARPHHRDLVQGRRRKASTSASAPSCAARTTPSCRSPCAW